MGVRIECFLQVKISSKWCQVYSDARLNIRDVLTHILILFETLYVFTTTKKKTSARYKKDDIMFCQTLL